MNSPSLNRSVVRRGAGLLAVTIPASFFNLALAYLAARILAQDAFGIFYSAITTINILFAPAVALNLFFTRLMAKIAARQGMAATIEMGRVVLRKLALWGAGLGLICFAAATAVDAVVPGFSLTVATLVLLVIYSSYLAEVGRMTRQAQNDALGLGIYSLSWMGLRCLLGLVGLLVFEDVWGGLLGIWLATLAVLLLVFRPRFALSPLPQPTLAAIRGMIGQDDARLGSLLRMASSYVLFLAAAHLDVLVAYLTLDRLALSVYAASSVLPKGLLIATLPIVQLTFPMLVGEKSQNRPVLSLVARGYVLVLGAGVIGAGIIALLRNDVCGGDFGIASCRPDVMVISLVPIVFFALLRQTISIAFAYQREWTPLLMAVPLLVGAGWMLVHSTNDVLVLSQSFLLFGAGSLVFYVLADLTVWGVSGMGRRLETADR